MVHPPPSLRARHVLAAALALGTASAVHAFHRETQPVTVITTSGDTDLPRLPSQGRRSLALAEGGDVATYLPYSTGGERTLLASGASPAVSFNGRTIAFQGDPDPLGRELAGSQVVLAQDGQLGPGVPDPSGTSANPSLDKRGTTLAFESGGDLIGLGEPGIVNRVYVRDKSGALTVASVGSGWSGNAMLSAKGGLIVFESTSDPETGVDTGTSQIWAGFVGGLPAGRITTGLGSSTNPIVSDDGRVVVFMSRAALRTDGVDTGVQQVFAYDVKTQTFAQITDDVGGCVRPAVAKVRQDWRITFVCTGQAFYHMLRENRRYHVPTPDGSTQAIVPEMGSHFVTVSTTADLASGVGGSTPGHQIYVLNLFKDPADPVPGQAVWFPVQGIPGL